MASAKDRCQATLLRSGSCQARPNIRADGFDERVALRSRQRPSVREAIYRRASLRPADARCRRLNAQHLTRRWPLEHILWTAPLGSQNEQRAAVRAAERAGEASAVEFDS